MNRKLALIISIGAVLFWTTFSYAVPFNNTVNFSGSGDYLGQDYLELSGSGSPFIYSYTHDVAFSPSAVSVTSAEVVLSHHNNSDNPGELWFLYQGTSFLIGELERSTGPGWVDQHFPLDNSIYSAISGSTWSLALSLQENTSGMDKLWINQSVLSGDYVQVITPNPVPEPPTYYQPGTPPNPVPEPTTMLLIGPGLIGLLGFRKKFKK